MRLPATRNVQQLLRRSVILCALIVLPYFAITSMISRNRNANQAHSVLTDVLPALSSDGVTEDDAAYPNERKLNMRVKYNLDEVYRNKSDLGNWNIIADSEPNDPDAKSEHISDVSLNIGSQSNLSHNSGALNSINGSDEIFSDTANTQSPEPVIKPRRSFGSPSSTEPIGLQSKLPLCPHKPPGLRGKMKQDVLLIPTLKESFIQRAHPELTMGGHWKPSGCIARHKVAIIIPFRDRQSHLNRIIEFLIPMLERQQLNFLFIVTEQYGHDLFNKGKIMNAAFILAERLGVNCVIFHDVDLFPQDDRNLYWCTDQPLHLGAYVNTLGYELWYNYLAGGVLQMRTEHYRAVNGYSNQFWAWGGEDDDMGYRILAQNMSIDRPDKITGRMTMLKHIKRQRIAPKMIYKLLKTSSVRWPSDGVSNTSEWRVLKVIQKPLYYHMFVDVGPPPKEWRDS